MHCSSDSGGTPAFIILGATSIVEIWKWNLKFCKMIFQSRRIFLRHRRMFANHVHYIYMHIYIVIFREIFHHSPSHLHHTHNVYHDPRISPWQVATAWSLDNLARPDGFDAHIWLWQKKGW